MECSPKEQIFDNLQIIGWHKSGFILEIILSQAILPNDPSTLVTLETLETLDT